MKRAAAGAAVAVLAWGAASAEAQDMGLHGFLQANYSVRTAEPAPGDPPGDFPLGDHRLQLELSRSSTSGSLGFLAKADLFHDAVASTADIDVREAYITLAGETVDVRLGRQIVTWGVGDLVFINDVFTKDWNALIAGRPLQYLKVGSDGANVNLYLGKLSAQVIAVPFFDPDRLPTGDRLVRFNPAPALPTVTRKPDQTVENIEWAGRLYGYLGRFDAAVYAYRGFWHSPPGMHVDTGTAIQFYPPLSVYGGSVQGGVATGVLSAEVGVYDSRDDRSGDNPTIQNSQLRFLVGFQQPVGSDVTIGAQYYAERMLDYDQYLSGLPPGFPSQAGTRHSLTGRLTRYFDYQTYQLSIFVWASPNEEDYYVNPELRYTIADDAWLTVGANVFGGSADHTFFGQFDRNDNVYATVRYTF